MYTIQAVERILMAGIEPSSAAFTEADQLRYSIGKEYIKWTYNDFWYTNYDAGNYKKAKKICVFINWLISQKLTKQEQANMVEQRDLLVEQDKNLRVALGLADLDPENKSLNTYGIDPFVQRDIMIELDIEEVRTCEGTCHSENSGLAYPILDFQSYFGNGFMPANISQEQLEKYQEEFKALLNGGDLVEFRMKAEETQRQRSQAVQAHERFNVNWAEEREKILDLKNELLRRRCLEQQIKSLTQSVQELEAAI